MTRECPHCHTDAFGLYDLVTLDYFHPSNCPNCNGLIRSSGWAQFLRPTITIVWILLLMSGLNFFPTWLVYSVLIFTVVLPWLILSRPVRADTPRVDLPPFTPDLHNDKSIVVKGWGENELRKIIDDFIAENPRVPNRVETHKHFEREWELRFPEDLPAFEFIAMVNYLTYPLNLQAADDVSVLGQATLTSDFQGMPQRFIGTKAIFYVPENDEDFDVVFVKADNRAIFSYSLSEQMWKLVSETQVSPKAAIMR